MANPPLLEVRGLQAGYGEAQVLWDVSITAERGSVVALVGANGAGKSTLLKTVSGLLRPRAGEIVFDGRSIAGIAPQQIVASGLSHVPEGRGLFSRMTVLENLQLGAYPAQVRARMDESLQRTYALFPRLRERSAQRAGLMSGGEQQMLAIGRAVMACPQLLILDEPSMGLGPLVVEEVFSLIRRLHDSGVTILLVEQNVQRALRMADRAFVLKTGRVVMQGTGPELLADEQIRKAYIGSLG
ncbi:MAG: ABC transporter ATP-binding protein [Ideonella sp.]|nr:MAG: ABC transporter ATP-binding protein [Burkholderiaceae bacterium]MBE7425197.1 ABC transporter ATP-binding protein [Ideonella sp.]